MERLSLKIDFFQNVMFQHAFGFLARQVIFKAFDFSHCLGQGP